MLIIVLYTLFVQVIWCWNKHMEVPGMFQGDIQLSPKERLQLRKHDYGSIIGGRWPGGKIPFYIESSLDGTGGRSLIYDAINDYHKFTCLRFRPKTLSDRNYISFYKGTGCNAPVGMKNGRNRISLDRGCLDKGTILHEIGHSIGLEHEQSRPDRDLYVTINYTNIDGDWEFAFDIVHNIDSLGTSYDFKSMMHYSSTAFAKHGFKTITTIDITNQHYIDTNDWIYGFSRTDIRQINLMYKEQCSGKNKVDKCTDLNTSCSVWAKNDYCRSRNPYMKVNCKKSCGIC